MSAVDLPDSARVEIAIAVVEHLGRFLVGVREAGTALSGYWEFPGGKIHAGETAEAAAARECREETGLEVRVVGRYESVDHDYDHARLRLHFLACEPLDAARAPGASFRWVAASELAQLRFPPANASLLAQLAAVSQ